MSQTTVFKYCYEGARLLAHSFNIMFRNPSGTIDFLVMIDFGRDVTY